MWVQLPGNPVRIFEGYALLIKRRVGLHSCIFDTPALDNATATLLSSELSAKASAYWSWPTRKGVNISSLGMAASGPRGPIGVET